MSGTEQPNCSSMGAVKRCVCRRNSDMPGTEVRVRRVGRGVLLEPIDIPFDVKAWFAKLDEYLDEPFMPEGRQQPPMPPPRKFFDE